MENSLATGWDEGRLPGVGGKGLLGSGHFVDGRRLGEQMPGFLPGLLSRGVWLGRSFENYRPLSSPTPPRLGRGHWAQALAFLLIAAAARRCVSFLGLL